MTGSKWVSLEFGTEVAVYSCCWKNNRQRREMKLLGMWSFAEIYAVAAPDFSG